RVGCLNHHRSRLAAHRVTYHRIAGGGTKLVPRGPWSAHEEIAVDDRHVLELDPTAESGSGRHSLRRVGDEDPLVVPFASRRAIEHDERPHESHVLEPDLLADQRAEPIASADLLRGEKRLARAIA